MSQNSSPTRLFIVDGLKALGCVLIVWHHLAFYGPMSDVVLPFAPGLINWLYDHARMAVQLFLVVGGFLAAAQLAPSAGAVLPGSPGALILGRYRRLVVPLLAALALSVGVAALVRPWMDHPSVPAAPELGQLLAHALLMQDLLGIEALSAGVWYVAIDFQLYALAVLLVWLSARPQGTSPLTVGLIGVLATLSLLGWNRMPALDVTALYFFGAYGLGMLAFWGSQSRHKVRWLLALLALGGLALWLDWRARVAVALLTALLLLAVAACRFGDAPKSGAVFGWRQAVRALARRSYSVFLVHFPVCLLVNAVVSHDWPGVPWVNALGMVVAFGLSLGTGWLLHALVERRQLRVHAVLNYQAVLLLCGLLVLTLEVTG